MSVTHIAEALNVSPRMVRKVAGGQVPGARYEHALEQLNRTGRVYTPPPRRTTRSGEPVKVRAPRAAGVKSAPPPPPPARPAAGKFGVETAHTAGGGRIVTVTMPKSAGALGREQARDELMRVLRGAANRKQRVSFELRGSTGKTAKLGSKGGYRALDAKRRSEAEGNDPLAWLTEEAEAAAHRSGTGSPPVDLGTVTRVTVQVY